MTRAEDVVLARDLGAWALGFVFAPSPRRLAPSAARALIDRVAGDARQEARSNGGGDFVPAPLVVGVFGDVSAEEIAQVAEQVGLDGVQLHGAAGPGARPVRKALAGLQRPLLLAGGLAARGTSADGLESARSDEASGPGPDRGEILIIQAVPVSEEESDPSAVRERVEQSLEDADLILLDTSKSGRFGGTGAAFPWAVARASAIDLPVLVAGGIDPVNVRTALEESSAWGVDVSSGVETSPGIKDARLMERLFAQVAMAGPPVVSGDGEEEQPKGLRR